jgi:hypothetical protein
MSDIVHIMNKDKKEYTFTTKQLISWAEKQKSFADSPFTKKSGEEAYIQALNHLIDYVKHPIREII